MMDLQQCVKDVVTRAVQSFIIKYETSEGLHRNLRLGIGDHIQN
jgi:hypothetical protein